MNKKVKFILSGIISIVIIYYGYSYFRIFTLKHSMDMKNYKTYLWIFNDSVKSNIDTFMFTGYINERDILYHYVMPDRYSFNIWEFKDLSVTKLKNIHIKENVELIEVNKNSVEKTEWGQPSVTIYSKIGLHLNQALTVNLDNGSKIIKQIESDHYKGFYGNIGRMTLNDQTGESLVMFDYKNEVAPSLFLMYKANDSFYVILTNSWDSTETKIDENTIKLFNLK